MARYLSICFGEKGDYKIYDEERENADLILYVSVLKSGMLSVYINQNKEILGFKAILSDSFSDGLGIDIDEEKLIIKSRYNRSNQLYKEFATANELTKFITDMLARIRKAYKVSNEAKSKLKQIKL